MNKTNLEDAMKAIVARANMLKASIYEPFNEGRADQIRQNMKQAFLNDHQKFMKGVT